jgi:hypothetical protein
VVFSSLRSLTGGGRQDRRNGLAPLLGFLPLRHLLRIGAASRAGDTILRLAGAYGFSPLHALHSAPIPSGLVSCRWRPWGCALQSVDLSGDPYPSRGRVPSCRFKPCLTGILVWSPYHSGVRADWRRRRPLGTGHRVRPCGRAWEAETRDHRGVTPEAVDLVASEDVTARVASCPGERGPVTRSAPRTTVRVPVEGRCAEARRDSPRTRNGMALRPRVAVRCLASCSAARGRRSLRIEPAKRHRIRRCRQVRSSFGRSRTKVRAEGRPPPPWLNGPWLVPDQGYEERAGKAAYRVLLPPGSRACVSGFGRSAGRCSPGLSPLQGFPPRRRGAAFATRSLAIMGPVAPEGGFGTRSTGNRRHRGWLVSFGDCRPS